MKQQMDNKDVAGTEHTESKKKYVLYGGVAGVVVIAAVVGVLLAGGHKREEQKATDKSDVVTEAAVSEEAVVVTEEATTLEESGIAEEESVTVNGNSVGNIFNNGIFVQDASGNFYVQSRTRQMTYFWDKASKQTVQVGENNIGYMNLVGNTLYGVHVTTEPINIIQYHTDTAQMEVLREGGAEYLQYADGMLYYTDAADHTLRCLNPETKEETVLLQEGIYYPVVHEGQIFFQRDSDGESIYVMSLETGELKKLNSTRSYRLMPYKDKLFYSTYVSEADEILDLRVMNLDGSEDRVFMDVSAESFNVYKDKLYFMDRQESSYAISYIDLTAPTPTITREDLTEGMKSLVAHLAEVDVADVEIDYCHKYNFAGEYMTYLSEFRIKGVNFAEQFFYNMQTGELDLLSRFIGVYEETDFSGMLEAAEGYLMFMEEYEEYLENGAETPQQSTIDESRQETQNSRQYPAGDYSVGSVYGPKLSQGELDQVADVVTTFLNTYDTASMDEYTKIATAHDYLCNNVSYAASWSQNGANTAWGALVYGEAQCSGYARAMKALCDAMNVGCYYVHADENASNPSHQWNQVCINGNWYIIDVQCNDDSGFKAFYLVSDDTYAAAGLSWDRSQVPACPSDYQ